MTPAEYEKFATQVIEDYAAQKVLSGEAHPEAAVGYAREETEKLLPDGIRTADMLLLTGYADNQPIGALWLALPSPQRTQAWIFMLLVDETQRGRGYGRAIMVAAEDVLTARGIHELGLNVFGHNTVARRLYEDLGYQVTAQQMAKRLG
ncbi:GNAT family N-acetyltransferase [Fodinicola feengrottensis]|nr:GNAT family N-acetyltransferase [Fodinicola feengrottensis]